jgi:hypothetical protein
VWGTLTALAWVVGLAFLWWRLEPLVIRLLAHAESRRLLAEAVDLRQDVQHREARQERRLLKAGQLALAEKRLNFESAYASDRMALAKHKVTVMEQQAAQRAEAQVAAIQGRQVQESTAMPIDLRMFISEQSEEFAREQMGQRAYELYAELKDWDDVRTALLS